MRIKEAQQFSNKYYLGHFYKPSAMIFLHVNIELL